MNLIITRPFEEATKIASQVKHLRLTPHIYPLLEVHALKDESSLMLQIRQLESYSLVIFVSPTAVSRFLHHVDFWPPAVKIGVVGSGSRARLQEKGIDCSLVDIIEPGRGQLMDSEALLAVIDNHQFRNSRVLIVRGVEGRTLLARSLVEKGFEVQCLSIYRCLEANMAGERRARLRELMLDCGMWVITSGRSFRVLARHASILLSLNEWDQFRANECLVIHPRLADVGNALGFYNIKCFAAGVDSMVHYLEASYSTDNY